MVTVELKVAIPEWLYREARDLGLLDADSLERLLSEEILRKRRVSAMFSAADQLAALDDPALDEGEVNDEIEAARREGAGAMRVVADTNVVISALMWRGPCFQVLDAARHGRVQLFTTNALLTELTEVLSRPKFAARLSKIGVAVNDLVDGYAALTFEVQPASIAPIIVDDPDDDAVLACALAANAEFIVSGDRHLQILAVFRNIPIVGAAVLCERLVTP